MFYPSVKFSITIDIIHCCNMMSDQRQNFFSSFFVNFRLFMMIPMLQNNDTILNIHQLVRKFKRASQSDTHIWKTFSYVPPYKWIGLYIQRTSITVVFFRSRSSLLATITVMMTFIGFTRILKPIV